MENNWTELAKSVLLKHLKKDRGEKVQKLIEIVDHTSEINAILECMNLVFEATKQECADNVCCGYDRTGKKITIKDSILNIQKPNL